MSQGLFIAIEGVECVGKTTQVERVARCLGASWTKEPGGNPVGQQIREILLHSPHPIHPMAEMLLMAADRAQNWYGATENVIRHGGIVVTDRSLYSAMAYQGFGRGLGEVVDAIHAAAGVRVPDIAVVIRVPNEVVRERMAQKDPDRFEREGDEFFERVQSGFRAIERRPGVVIIDGLGEVEEVTARIVAVIKGTDAWQRYASLRSRVG